MAIWEGELECVGGIMIAKTYFRFSGHSWCYLTDCWLVDLGSEYELPDD